MAQIVIVDDDRDVRGAYAWMLQKNGHTVSCFSDGPEFLLFVENEGHTIDLVLCDIHLIQEDGIELFKKSRALGLRCPFLLMTSFGDFNDAVQALKTGVADYLIKPIEEEILLQKVSSYLQYSHLQQETFLHRLGRNLVANSPSMQAILQKLSRVANSKAGVLFTGESGTGKEILSRTLHEISPRSSGPFIAVNVSAIPETLFEAEFFGYRKGAFTDAIRDYEGYARLADGGTLFLDEVADMALSSQAKLLRLLEERKVQPLGSKEIFSVDFRVLSATNKDLKQLIQQGRFREDLYYRLAVVAIEIPPLRMRVEDLIPLSRHLLQDLCREEAREILDFTPQAQARILSYSWPGNVRELKNRIHDALLTTQDQWIDASDLNLPGKPSAPRNPGVSYEQARSAFEKRYIRKLLRLTRGNVKGVASISGLSRKTIYELMKRHNISPKSFRLISNIDE